MPKVTGNMWWKKNSTFKVEPPFRFGKHAGFGVSNFQRVVVLQCDTEFQYKLLCENEVNK